MRRSINPVHFFIRNIIRWVIAIPLWVLISRPLFIIAWRAIGYGVPGPFLVRLFFAIVSAVLILWIANIISGMFYVLPQWERMVLLRLGRFVGVKGPGLFLIPPFIYSVARIIKYG